MNAPLSVIIASYNGMPYLEECLDGLAAQGMPLQIIVVDDGSTDDSPQLARERGCRVLTVPHAGQAAARNRGLRLAEGDFVLFNDQDDVLQPHALQRMADVLRHGADVAAVMAQARDFVSPELGEQEKANICPRAMPYFGFLGATLFRKSVFNAIGNFSENFRAGEATDMLFRLKISGLQVERLPFAAMMRRLHGSNASRLLRHTQFTDYAELLRKHMNFAR